MAHTKQGTRLSPEPALHAQPGAAHPVAQLVANDDGDLAVVVPLHPSVVPPAPEQALGQVATAELDSPETQLHLEWDSLAPVDDVLLESWADVLDEVPLLDSRMLDDAEPEHGAPLVHVDTLIGIPPPPAGKALQPLLRRSQGPTIDETELTLARALVRGDKLGQAHALLRGLARRVPDHATVRRLMSELRCRVLGDALRQPPGTLSLAG